MSIDKNTIFFVTVVLVTIFDSAEAKLLTLHMEGLARCVLQRKDGRIQVRLLSIPQFGVISTEFCFSLVAGNDIGRTRGHLLAVGI